MEGTGFGLIRARLIMLAFAWRTDENKFHSKIFEVHSRNSNWHLPNKGTIVTA